VAIARKKRVKGEGDREGERERERELSPLPSRADFSGNRRT
jgi:hypothetical protein